ncbi:MAG: glutamine amidotransferase [Thaumarchaeota archaeon]|nr:glutamine amidotransferase [Nitrososphaerota archaeon]
MLLMVNNVSSYSNNLEECLNKLNTKYVVHKYDELDDCSISNYDGIILSGRTKSVKAMNVSNMNILKSAYKDDKPLLGICYGVEIAVLTFNGSLQRLNNRIIGDNNITVKKESILTKRNTLNVFENHGYHIARLPEEFICIADSSSCKYEIIAHTKKHIFGTQFHPEMSIDGIEILRNFVGLTKN